MIQYFRTLDNNDQRGDQYIDSHHTLALMQLLIIGTDQLIITGRGQNEKDLKIKNTTINISIITIITLHFTDM